MGKQRVVNIETQLPDDILASRIEDLYQKYPQSLGTRVIIAVDTQNLLVTDDYIPSGKSPLDTFFLSTGRKHRP